MSSQKNKIDLFTVNWAGSVGFVLFFVSAMAIFMTGNPESPAAWKQPLVSLLFFVLVLGGNSWWAVRQSRRQD